MATPLFVPVFDGNQYESWSVKMKTLLKAMDLWDVVETVPQEPPEETSMTTCHDSGIDSNESSSSTVSAEYCSARHRMEMKKDMSALNIIQNGVTTDIFSWIACAKSSKEAWELLMVRSLGGPILQSRKLNDLKKEYKDMKMRSDETIHEFTGKLMELVFRMKSCGWKVEDREVARKIISSLPPRFYDNVIGEVAETLEISVLIDFLLVHEYNMNKPAQESLENFLSLKDILSLAQESSEERRERLQPFKDIFVLGCIFVACVVIIR